MSVYEFVELVGTSNESWGKAAARAVQTAGRTFHQPRVAEVTKLDVQILGESFTFRAKVKVSARVKDGA